MTVTVLNIIPRKQAENVQTNQYTAVNCKTIIDKFTATNNTGANVTFAVNLVASGGAADATNKTLPTKTIAPGDCYQCPELIGQSLEPGGFISTLAGTAAALVISATAREIT
jgi:IMP cyclohydrolase